MDLRSQEPFWPLKNGLLGDYPSLSENIQTEVAIIGGGISGALIAWNLSQAGVDTIVVDKRHVGMGSTAASTALLQYEIDTPLLKLCEKVGEKNAVESYKVCLQSITDIKKICSSLKRSTDFEWKESLQFASFNKDVGELRKEFELRKKHGIEIRWLTRDEIMQHWGFQAPAGVLSKTGAQVDPFKLTHALLHHCALKGMPIYEGTEITRIVQHPRKVELWTQHGNKITAKKIIMANGYESQKYINKKVAALNSTYAMISEPMADKKVWYKNCLIWETATPYSYMRITRDNRIILGGKDDEFSDPKKRDGALPRKVKQLEKVFARLFPAIPFKTDFQWAGTFASTKDGLPYIGSVPEQPHTYFALGFGGNGITYSAIAAKIIRDHLTGKKNDHARLFSFNR